MMERRGYGFTIVELLIVIVVIAILAAISVVAYNGIQERGRDSQRKSDVATIAKALEMYYIDNGAYPSSSNGGSAIASYWTTTADSSWGTFMDVLSDHISAEGLKDPVSTPGIDSRYGTGYNYSYYSNAGAGYCGTTAANQMYILVYKMDTQEIDTLNGDCSTNQLLYGSGGVSNYRVVKK